MDQKTDSAKEIIRAARVQRGWTQDELANKVGTNQQTIGKIESGKIKHSRLFPKIAAELGVPVGKLIPDVGDGLVLPDSHKIVDIPAIRLGGDLPVHASAQGGRGEMIVSSDPVDWVSRPAPLANVTKGYGIIIVGESMIPEFEPGDTALINPHLPPVRGVTCVFYAEGNGDVRATIKRLVSFNDRFWMVRQWNPVRGQKAEFTLAKADWAKCHRVVGKYSAR